MSRPCDGVQACPSEDVLAASANQLIAFGLELQNVFEQFIASALLLLLHCHLN